MESDRKKAELIPLLLLRGRTFLFKEYSKKALSEFSKELRRRGFEKLYIMDLDGLERNKPQLDIVQRLSDDFAVLYEGGARRGSNIIDFIMAGAEMVYLNTASIESFEEIKIALTYSENVGLKIDWNEGIIGKGFEAKSLQSILLESAKLGIRDFVLPVEVIPHIAGIRLPVGSVIRAIADRPGDEMMRNIEASSIIINHELIEDGK